MDGLSQGETPYIYDFWSGLWLLSTCVGRHCYVPRPQIPVRLNLYVMFVSDSGITRKTTTINFAREILRAYDRCCSIPVVESKETPESLELRLIKLTDEHQHSHLTICVSELMRFLGKQAYSNAMPGLLTDLFDSPSSRTAGSIQFGQAIYNNVYLTFLAGTTPRWLEKAVHPDVVEGGFTSRTFFITATNRKQLDPWSNSDEKTREQNVSNIVQSLRDTVEPLTQQNEIPLTPKAIEWYKRWYRRLARQRSTSAFIESFLSREPDHVLRCGALLAINAQEYRVDVNTLKLAAKIVSDVRTMGSRLFAGGRYVGDRTKAINRITETLIAVGNAGIKRTDLMQKCRYLVTTQELRDTIQIMVESELIAQVEIPPVNGVGRPALYYVGTDKLRSAVAREAVADSLNEDI